ncbi:hypothetical protein KPL78_15515 [Roseomonas sp. HJA6]|uniref:Uncharacterized protein n=1 Tax=Roseomonas alba TaxID=2846776 RepID=A0ABS7AAE0_9PROT|nr:hypothetical protein [Neoroseomonas alba]
MELGIQPTFGTADKAGKSPFLSRLAAARWALTWVLSIISRSGGPASATRAIKMRSNTPRRLRRTKRL